jgi:hypothetical protein
MKFVKECEEQLAETNCLFVYLVRVVTLESLSLFNTINIGVSESHSSARYTLVEGYIVPTRPNLADR